MKQNHSTRLYITFYMDENVSLDLARMIAKEDYDVLTAHDVGMLGKSDSEQLEYAKQLGRTLVTHDRDDFITLNREWLDQNKKHYGILLLIGRKTLREMARRLLAVLDSVTADEMEDQLRFV